MRALIPRVLSENRGMVSAVIADSRREARCQRMLQQRGIGGGEGISRKMRVEGEKEIE